MSNLSPIALSVLIVISVAAVGGLVTLIRRTTTFRGYEELAGEVRQIAKALKGEVFRDGNDLVVAGSYAGWPVILRFSHAENTPGLSMRMQAPASFTLWISARSRGSVEGRAQLRTGDQSFDTRFSSRSDHPTRAGLLLGAKHLAPVIQRLCCSLNTLLAITTGNIELTEMVTPTNPAAHVLEHLEAMGKLAKFLRDMPGAEQVKVTPMRKERHLVGRLAISAGILAAVVTVVAAMENPQNGSLQVFGKAPTGVLPVDAARIPALLGYRLASVRDFDQQALSWLRANRREPAARVSGNFSGKGDPFDAAYVLIGPDGSRRVVMLAGREDRFDIKYPEVGIIARVPKTSISSIEWVGLPPQEPDGDGLLIVRKSGDSPSAVMAFLSGGRVITATPANYQLINLD